MAKFFINAGHCADYDERTNRLKDAGAINRDYNLTEAECVAKIGKLVKRYLMIDGHDAIYLQSNNLRNGYNDDFDYPCIIDECNYSDCDYAISIHLNAFNGIAKGTETWVHYRNSTGELLGEYIQDSLVRSLCTVDRGIKYNVDKPENKQLSFLKKTYMPAVLIECCFIDSNEDAQLLLNNDGIEKIAIAIVDGINNFLGEC